MTNDIDLEDRLHRLRSGLDLSPADLSALARLRGPHAKRSRRNWSRATAIPLAITAVFAACAVAIAASDSSVILRFHPIGSTPPSKPVKVAGPLCPHPETMSLPQIQRQANFHVLTISGATLMASSYTACPGQGVDQVGLLYQRDGVVLDLNETRAPEGPVQVDLKGSANDTPWRIIRIDGNDYAVLIQNGLVLAATFKLDGTQVDLMVGVKGNVGRPLMIADFEQLVRQIS